MNLQDLLKALTPFLSAKMVSHDMEHLAVLLTPDEYTDMREAIDNIRLADMVNYMKAQAAFPKLLSAVKLIIALNAGLLPDERDKVKLSSKTKARLMSALKAAGE